MRRRYYLSMFSVVLFVMPLDLLYIGFAGSLDLQNLLAVVAFDTVLFIGVNWLGIRLIFRPIGELIDNKRFLDEVVHRRIQRLALMSSGWMAVLGGTYAFSISLMTVYIYPDMAPTLPLRSYGLWGAALFYCGFTTLYSFFLITNYVMILKLYLTRERRVEFPSEHGKIWRKLGVFYLAVLAVYLTVLVDIYVWGSLADLKEHAVLFTVMVGGTAIACTVIYLITTGITHPINMLLASHQEVYEGNYSVRTPVVSNDEVGILAASFNHMVEGLQEREFVREAFGKYVAQSVADEILKQNVDLAGELRLASILFTDIENYTALTEHMHPQDVVRMLNEYFSLVVGTVTRHRGIVNKFIGDSVFAIFNAPLADEKHAHNAVRTALEIQHLAQGERFGRHGVSLDTRVGINTGLVVVGSIGGQDRLEYTAIGDEVNVASRLEQLNKIYGTRILVGENTYELAKDEFDFERIGEVELKGKTKTVPIYKLGMQSA